MSSLLLQHGIQPTTRHRSITMARTGHCEDFGGTLLRECLPAASPHSHAKALKATLTLLMHRLELTHRQAEVLHWIAEGKTNDEISLILGCSFFTVKNHVKKVFQRLGVHSRTAAAASAYRAHIAFSAEADVSRASLPISKPA